MGRRAHRNLVDGLRDFAGDLPRPGRAFRHEPDALEAHVVEVADLQDVLVGVDRPLHRRLLDRLELGRSALILDVGGRHGPTDARGLRNPREQHRLNGLSRTGHRRQHARSLVLDRNLFEVVWQGRCGERPGAREIRRRKPPAGHQEVDRTGHGHSKEVAIGVADPQELLCTLDLQVVGFPSQQNQFGRFQGDKDFRHVLGAHLLTRQGRLHVFPILIRRELGETRLAVYRPESTGPSRRSP